MHATRCPRLVLLVASCALLLAGRDTASAANAFSGALGNSCTASWSLGNEPAMLIGLRTAGFDEPDVLFDATLADGASAGLARLEPGGGWSLPPNWRGELLPDDVVVALVLAPGRLAIDSDTSRSTGGDLGTCVPQPVGSVGPRAPRVTPVAGGYRLEFAPVRELGWLAEGPCDLAGCRRHGRPVIIGYNVYRLPVAAFPTPRLSDFRLHGYLAHGRMADFDQNVASVTGAAADLTPNDEWRLVNGDGLPHTGDELMVFDDVDRRPDGTVRERAPDPTQAYWYRVQPVLGGRASFFTGDVVSSQALPAVLIDRDGDGHAESVDLLADGLVEFVDPSGQGLGLALAGEILSSRAAGLGAPPVRTGGGGRPVGAPAPPPLRAR